MSGNVWLDRVPDRPHNTGPAYVITYRHRRGRLPGAGPGPDHIAEPLMVPGRHQGFSEVRGKG